MLFLEPRQQVLGTSNGLGRKFLSAGAKFSFWVTLWEKNSLEVNWQIRHFLSVHVSSLTVSIGKRLKAFEKIKMVNMSFMLFYLLFLLLA